MKNPIIDPDVAEAVFFATFMNSYNVQYLVIEFEKRGMKIRLEGGVDAVVNAVKEFAEGKVDALLKFTDEEISIADVINKMIENGFNLLYIRYFEVNREYGYDVYYRIGDGKICNIVHFSSVDFVAYNSLIRCMKLR